MTYVDGFVLVIQKNKVAEYKKIARMAGKIWKKHGAIEYKECIGDDLNPHMGGQRGTSFPKLTKLKRNETVWFSFIVYRNKTHRDKVNKAVMNDPMMSPEAWKDKPMPFDMTRISYGGFRTMIDL